MESIQPKGEKVRKAIQWISETRTDEPLTPIPSLIERASLRFNLSPKEEAFLRSFYEQAR